MTLYISVIHMVEGLCARGTAKRGLLPLAQLSRQSNSKKTNLLNARGDALRSVNMPGNRHRTVHDVVVRTLVATLKTTGITAYLELSGIFTYHVPTARVRKLQTISPDILAYLKGLGDERRPHEIDGSGSANGATVAVTSTQPTVAAEVDGVAISAVHLRGR